MEVELPECLSATREKKINNTTLECGREEGQVSLSDEDYSIPAEKESLGMDVWRIRNRESWGLTCFSGWLVFKYIWFVFLYSKT